MWTPAALRCEARPYAGPLWRVVEGQARASTLRLTESLRDQQILEEEIESAKPRLPPGTAHLHPLLRTPFRYEPYPGGSRFRRAHQREGVFYGAERGATAIAEMAFYRLLFLAEAPGMTPPDRALEVTAFAVEVATEAVDLTQPPLEAGAARWTDLVDYAACQDLADIARGAAIGAIRYASVRDPGGGCNVAVLDWRAFAAPEPAEVRTWHLLPRPCGAIAVREFPRLDLEFGHADFGADPRLRTLFADCP
ncbi:RES family NAD+ phosphorylase [Novispirillum sp. DQ9]|uniref:RES family NAD+ phosphorylase n=1 Tax=Novispirillum sp. DQ9 TaxID=3398612 RepID=UPI003C797983